MMKTIAKHAEELMREKGYDAVMQGDANILHEIAERAGRKHNSWKTEKAILNALERGVPDIFVKRYAGFHRRVRVFYLKDKVPGSLV